MITIDPIEVPRFTPEEAAEDERQQALEKLERLANPALANLSVPAPPGSGRRVTGGTAYPPGTHPPPDPRTAARGAEDIYGSDPFGGGGPQPQRAPMQSQSGAGRSLAAPPQEPVRGATPRPELLAAMERQGVGRSLGDPSGQRPAPPPADPNPPPHRGADPTQPPENTRAKLGRLLAARAEAPERDYTGVDVADAVARPFRAIARGLAYASGRQPGEMASWGDQARGRDRQTDSDAARAAAAASDAAGEAQDRALAERRVGTAERAQEALAERQQALSETGQAREERTAQIAARALELREQGMESGAALTQARIEAIRSAQAERIALRDPESPESLRAVDRFGRRVAHVGQVTGQDLDITAEGLAAEDVRAMEQGLGQTRSARLPGRRAGGGGAQSAEATRALAREAGLSETEVAAYGTSRRDMERLRTEAEMRMRARSRSGAGDEGIEIAPGVRSTLGRVRPADAARMADGIATARSQAANIRGIGAIAANHPVGANISPEARAQLTPRLTIARGMVATLGNTGVINANEVPTINGALPNPADLEQMTFGTFQARLRTWQRILEERVAADLSTNGVDEAGVSRVIGWLRGSGGGRAPTGPAAPAGGPQSDMVRVRRPDGVERSVSRQLAERARARGWEVIDGP